MSVHTGDIVDRITSDLFQSQRIDRIESLIQQIDKSLLSHQAEIEPEQSLA